MTQTELLKDIVIYANYLSYFLCLVSDKKSLIHKLEMKMFLYFKL